MYLATGLSRPSTYSRANQVFSRIALDVSGHGLAESDHVEIALANREATQEHQAKSTTTTKVAAKDIPFAVADEPLDHDAVDTLRNKLMKDEGLDYDAAHSAAVAHLSSPSMDTLPPMDTKVDVRQVGRVKVSVRADQTIVIEMPPLSTADRERLERLLERDFGPAVFAAPR